MQTIGAVMHEPHPGTPRRGRLGLVLLGVAALFVSGCGASLEWTSTHPAPHEMKPIPADQVEVFTLKAPTRPYAEVGLIDAGHKGGTFSAIGNSEVLRKGREYAGAKGCDAVVVNDVTNTFQGVGNAVANQKGYQLTCIVWTGK